MKKLRRLLLLTLLLCLYPSVLVHAESTEPVPGTYQAVMASEVSSFLITSQPNDAVAINTHTALDSSMLGTCQDGVYFNLPRLKNTYHYVVVQETPKWELAQSMYPALYLPQGVTSPANYTMTLQIWNTISGSCVASCEVSITEQLTGAQFTPYIPDIYVLLSQGSSGSGNALGQVVALNTETRYYNPILHKSGLVCPNAMYITSNPGDVWLNTTLKFDYDNPGHFNTIVDGTVDLTQYEKSDAVITAEYWPTSVSLDLGSFRLKPYCYSSEGALGHMYTEKYNPITGELLGGAGTDVQYFIAGDDELVVGYKADSEPTAGSELAVTLKTNNHYSYVDITRGYITKLPDTHFKYYPKLNSYYVYTITSLPDATYFAPNFYAISPPVTWSGTGADVTPRVPDEDTETYSLRYTYTTGMTSAYVKVTPGEAPVLGTPTKTGFKFVGWYVDENLTTAYDSTKFSYVLGATYNLYPKWEVTGTYTVRFYDDKTGLDSQQIFSVDDQPVLPDNPVFTGYLFKNWMIVDTIVSANGTVYDAATFVPEANRTYVFKANWDLQGIILSVTPTKTEYWLKDEIDKKELVVLVQTDNAGSTKTLSISEFAVTPNTVDKAGDNAITVTYLETGATATVHLTGKADYLTGITAKYTGDDLNVSDAIPKGAIEVKLKYKSGKTVETSDFSISPATIRATGTNTITVTASGFSTSITINGIRKAVVTNPTAETALTGISAVYSGPQLYVGDDISPGDFRVTAKYSDGSTATLNASEFNYTPSFVKTVGANTITISYKDKSTKVTISALTNSSMIESGSTFNPITGQPNSTIVGSANGTTTGTGVEYTGNGGAGIATDAKNKGTSVGYLNGKNILDSTGAGGDKVIVNEVDILEEIKSAGSRATSVNVSLINTAEGNYLTSEMVDELIKKKLTLNVTMLSPADKQTRVGLWSFNGKSISAIENSMDLNLSFSKLEKSNEKAYVIGVSPSTFGTGISCDAIMKDAYVEGTFINIYKVNSEYSDSEHIRNFLWNNSSTVELPLYKGSYFIVSDLAETYPNGSDMTEDNSRLDITDEEVVEEDTTISSDVEEPKTEVDVKPVTEVRDESSDEKGGVPILPIAIALGAVVVLGGVGFTVFRVIKNKQSTIEDEEVVYEDEDVVYEDEYVEDADDEEFLL